jgi:hypothetical protein
MNLKNLVVTLLCFFMLVACGSSDGGSASKPINDESGVIQEDKIDDDKIDDDKDKELSDFTFLEQSENGMNYLNMDIVEVKNSSSIMGTTANNPLDVYPNEPFEFRWQLDSLSVVNANNFFVINVDDGQIPLFGVIMNPVSEILTNKATCEYNNDHVLICDLVPIQQHTGEQVTTSLSATFISLPKTFEVVSSICSFTSGCDKIRLGYIRFN